MGKETPVTQCNACNAETATGLCNAEKTPRQKFCRRCTTRIRVARLRSKNAPQRKLKARADTDYGQEKLYAGAGLRDAGRFVIETAQTERNEKCRALRQASVQERKNLNRERRKIYQDAYGLINQLKKDIKRLTPALKRAIAKADALLNQTIQTTGRELDLKESKRII